eukprot:CAMPEP_0177715780 /NCGR_PEP_ID=MMETSP0484_2-20121128/14173_1 /TAXON_ID=354590 /ORGANISM="Rhodomonas lens, Strain RHODO" /LENGTH=263 /DNA_ID=CAMNT_0019227795 /DNA_START=20 /DNA_END=811 /DNA_ORIENTATION=+
MNRTLPLFAALLGAALLAPAACFQLGAVRAPALRVPSSSSPCLPKVATLARTSLAAPRCQVIFNSNDDWKPDHHKDQANSGNVDVGDYFPDDNTPGSASDPNAGLGLNSGAAAAATGGGANNRLDSLLSAGNTEIRTVEKAAHGPVEFKAHAWRIDGDYASGDPRYDLKYSAATSLAETEIMVEPNSMTYEDFVAGWTADTDASLWEVTPTEGSFDRRGGDPTFFDIRWKGSTVMKGEHFGTLVIVLPNDNFSYTYKFRVTVS